MANNYLDLVTKNRGNVKKGAEFTTERKLFKALGLNGNYKGNDLISVRKAISCWFEYTKVAEGSSKVKVTKKFNKMKNNTQADTKFSDMGDILIDLLARTEQIEKDTWAFSKSQLMHLVGLCSKNMSVISYNTDVMSKELGINEMYLKQLCDDFYKTNRGTVETYLNRLKKERRILFNKDRHMVVQFKNSRFATQEEEVLIMNMERQALDNIGIRDMNVLFTLGRYPEFKKEMDNLIKENKAQFEFYYGVYTITTGEEYTKKVMTKRELLMKKQDINDSRIEQFSEKHIKLNEKVVAEEMQKIERMLVKTDGRHSHLGRATKSEDIFSRDEQLEKFIDKAISISTPYIYYVNEVPEKYIDNNGEEKYKMVKKVNKVENDIKYIQKRQK